MNQPHNPPDCYAVWIGGAGAGPTPSLCNSTRDAPLASAIQRVPQLGRAGETARGEPARSTFVLTPSSRSSVTQLRWARTGTPLDPMWQTHPRPSRRAADTDVG